MMRFLKISDWKDSRDLRSCCGDAAVCVKGWANVHAGAWLGGRESVDLFFFFFKEKPRLSHTPGFWNCACSITTPNKFQLSSHPGYNSDITAPGSSEDWVPFSISIPRSPWDQERTVSLGIFKTPDQYFE